MGSGNTKLFETTSAAAAGKLSSSQLSHVTIHSFVLVPPYIKEISGLEKGNKYKRKQYQVDNKKLAS